jgi:hypothetical protein
MRALVKTVAGAVVGDIIGRRQGHGLLGAGIGLVATRIATRSIPGALLVGGAILAKTVYDRRKERHVNNPAISPSDNTPSLPPANS